MFPRLASARESSRVSAAPTYSVDLFILVHVGELEARLTNSRIICTYTDYCTSGIFDLAASGTILSNAHPAFLAQKEPVRLAVGFGISTQVASSALSPYRSPKSDFGDHLRRSPSGYVGKSFLPNGR